MTGREARDRPVGPGSRRSVNMEFRKRSNFRLHASLPHEGEGGARRDPLTLPAGPPRLQVSFFFGSSYWLNG